MANSTAVKGGRKKEGLIECLTGLEDAAQKVLRLSKDVKDAEGIADEARRLRSEIREKDKAIAEKETANRALVEHFELKAVKSHQEKIELQKSLEAARTDQRTTRKLDAALKEALAAKEEAQSKEAKLLEASAQATGFKIELGRTRAQLDDLHKCIGLAEPGSSLIQTIEKLADDLHALACKYGGCALPESCDKDQLFVSLYQSGFLDAIPQGTPISMSQFSVLLRTAAVECIITKEMNDTILQELFPWTLTGESGLLGIILEDFSRVDPRKEAIFRALICSPEVQNRSDREVSAIASVVDEVVKVCSPLLDVNNLQVSFREDLEALLFEVVKFWTKAQTHRKRTVSVRKAEAGAAGWDIREVYGKLPDDAAHLDLGYPVAVLFPQLYQVMPNEDPDILHHGYTVWPEQDIYVKAKMEFHTQRRRVNEHDGGRTEGGNRRHSIGDRRLRRSVTARIGKCEGSVDAARNSQALSST